MNDFNKWAAVAEAMHDETVLVVKKVAFSAEANVKTNTVGVGAVDTGFMLGSAYTVTKDGSTYKGGTEALPAVVDAVENDTTAYVAVAAKYGQYVNGGTSRMAARPFFDPAIEKANEELDSAMGAVKGAMERAAS